MDSNPERALNPYVRDVQDESEPSYRAEAQRVADLEASVREMANLLRGTDLPAIRTALEQQGAILDDTRTRITRVEQRQAELAAMASGSVPPAAVPPVHVPVKDPELDPRPDLSAFTEDPLYPTPTTSDEAGTSNFKVPTKGLELGKYKGERKNGACEEWCMEAELHVQNMVDLAGKTPPAPGQVVAYLAMHLSGPAAKWWSNVSRAEPSGLGTRPRPRTMLEFFAALQHDFLDLNADERRRDRWERIRQTTSVQNFYQELMHEYLSLVPRPSEYELLRRMKDGLKKEIWSKMRQDHNDIKDPHLYIHKADDIDQALFDIRRGERSTHHKSLNQSSRNGKKETGRMYALDSSTPSKAENPQLYKQWCVDNKRCFHCGSSEHFASKCPRAPPKI
jgi:hypothetical protein